MPEFWQVSEQRGHETLTVWRQHLPLMAVGGTTPDRHAADIARLEPLAQAVVTARTEARTVKQRELAAFERIRWLNLNVPQVIVGQFADDHPVPATLAAVYQVVPRSDELNLRRARLLVPIWKNANAELASRQPAQTVEADGVGVADFEKLIADYPKVLQATAESVTDFRQARAALRAQHGRVDRLNKRAYKKFQAEARTNESLKAAMRTGITRERTSGSRRKVSG
jgi:hypothetical protein